MLTALLNSKPFIVFNHSKEELRSIRKGSPTFICPHCLSPLILKVGQVKAPHFSHAAKVQCPFDSRKETREHIWSKTILYQRLTHLYEDVKLECYVPQIKQIPDLMISAEERRIAIEIQHSTIPLQEVGKRTVGYSHADIHPLWILIQSIQTGNPIKLTRFQQGFIRFSKELHYFLLHFNPGTKCFTILPHLMPISNNTFLHSKNIVIPLDSFTLPISFQRPGSTGPHLLSNWPQYRKKWIIDKINYRSLKYDRFLREVYEAGDTFQYLPLYIGLPVMPHATILKTHPIQWQYYIWKDVLKRDRIFSKESVLRAIAERLGRGDIEARDFPLMTSGGAMSRLVGDYLTILEKLRIVKNEGSAGFSLVSKWECPGTFNDFLLHERGFFPNWKHILKMD
ncbi:hypothetical protein LCM10_17250 [Rossellomorea aquimaris]|uniref:competence protein CoiA n=1 Tax=Rossellomorea aquimaris TaxID=189382 RepID=UPI001CD4ECDD|nr:competence protein CoiA family protein [Rossellomorea aquimaris]MCA1056733.1 hypothetical protein [Rossellomorea aquimaris]